MTTKAMTRLAVILVTLCIGFSTSALKAGESNLPKRDGNRPQTTNSVPHVQIGVSPNPAINEAFLLEVSKLPGVEIRPTVVSLPGAKGFWLNEELTLAHPEVIVGGREFAHIHPRWQFARIVTTGTCQGSSKGRLGSPPPLGQPTSGMGGLCDALYSTIKGREIGRAHV